MTKTEETLANTETVISKASAELNPAKTKPIKKVEKKKELKTYQIKSELKKMYPKMSAGEISRKFDVNRGVILHYLRKFEIPITTRTSETTGPAHPIKGANRSYRKKEWLEEQLKSGLSMYKISVVCKVNFGNVKHYCEKFKLMGLVVQQRAKAKT